MQFLKVPEFQSPTQLDGTDELYKDFSEENRKAAEKYVRLLIREKLNRPVPVLVDKDTMKCMQLMQQYRKEVGILKENNYFFALPSTNKHTRRTIDVASLLELPPKYVEPGIQKHYAAQS